jgi:hypothetical protein
MASLYLSKKGQFNKYNVSARFQKNERKER